MGLGSNLLMRDGGVRGVVISTRGTLDALERRGEREVYAEAGVPCARLARQCARWDLGPAEFFTGIPGTVGGALAMNAGAFGGETWPVVQRVETVDRSGTCGCAQPPNTKSVTGMSRRRQRRMVPRRHAAFRARVCGQASDRGLLERRRRRSPSASGVADRCSPIRPTITPRA